MLKSTIDVEIDLPAQAIKLKPVIEAFNTAHDMKKQYTEWFVLCSKSPSLKNWNKRTFNDNRINDIEFARGAARAYLELFQLKKQDVPNCKASTVIKLSGLAKEMIVLLPNNAILPGNSTDFDYLPWLSIVSALRPSDILKGASNRGKPLVRWLVKSLAMEFCYSFACEPPVSIIGDLIRLGWPDCSDRSIRNTFTSELSLQALESARVRRENDNKSKTIAHQVISALPSRSKEIVANPTMKVSLAPNGESDKEILEFIEGWANKLNDRASARRLISIIESMQYDERNYLEDYGN